MIHLAEHPAGLDPQPLVQEAVHHNFADRARLNRLEFKRLMKEGRRSLLIGLVFLSTCLLLSELLLLREADGLWKVIRESLTIGGWVAMWRPLQIYLYEWWPLRRRGKIFQKLSRMPVEVRRTDEAIGLESATAVEKLCGAWSCSNGLAAHRKSRRRCAARSLTLPPIVPKGQNMNSRGRQPTVQRGNIFDPVGVAPFFNHSTVDFTHGYSCLAASRPQTRGQCQRCPDSMPQAAPRGDESQIPSVSNGK